MNRTARLDGTSANNTAAPTFAPSLRGITRDELLKMRENGMSNAEIGNAIGSHRNSVYRVIGPEPREITSSTFREAAKNRWQKKIPSDNDMRAMHVGGKSHAEIAAVAGISAKEVAERLAKYRDTPISQPAPKPTLPPIQRTVSPPPKPTGLLAEEYRIFHGLAAQHKIVQSTDTLEVIRPEGTLILKHDEIEWLLAEIAEAETHMPRTSARTEA